MRVLLGSGGFRTPERIANLRRHLHAHFGDIDQVLFIAYALQDHDKYVQILSERGLNADRELLGIHRCPDPEAAVRSARAIYVGGGNTFRLLDALYRHNLLGAIRQRVQAGVPYVGISAGSNVAGPSIKTTNDMPIVQPASFAALGLVPFQINPHYYAGANWVINPLTPSASPPEGRRVDLIEHLGETRDDRIREFHELNDTPVVGLWEAGVLVCDGATVMLHDAPARVFRKGQPAIDVEPGAELGALL